MFHHAYYITKELLLIAFYVSIFNADSCLSTKIRFLNPFMINNQKNLIEKASRFSRMRDDDIYKYFTVKYHYVNFDQLKELQCNFTDRTSEPAMTRKDKIDFRMFTFAFIDLHLICNNSIECKRKSLDPHLYTHHEKCYP